MSTISTVSSNGVGGGTDMGCQLLELCLILAGVRDGATLPGKAASTETLYPGHNAVDINVEA